MAVAEPAAADARPIRYLHPARPDFLLLDKPLSLDDAQEAVLQHQPPLVLVGSAGSGKTALLLQRLRWMPGRVAYVTESKWLAESARSLYVAFDGAPPDQEAEFLSYQQLLETVEVLPGRPVTFRDFLGFFERHRQKIKFADAHQVFEELRGVLTAEPEGPFSRESYLALGVRQSMSTPGSAPRSTISSSAIAGGSTTPGSTSRIWSRTGTWRGCKRSTISSRWMKCRTSPTCSSRWCCARSRPRATSSSPATPTRSCIPISSPGRR